MHICALADASESSISNTTVVTSTFAKFSKKFKKYTLISEKNPRSRLFFRSNASIYFERKRHLQSGYTYIIHPFSWFRVYWESFMILVFICSLVIIPLSVLFCIHYQLKTFSVPQIILLILDTFCCADIVVQCFTGHDNISSKKVTLEPNKIVWIYFRSGNFIIDIFTSIPSQVLVLIFGIGPNVVMHTQLFSLLKGLRSRTLYKYMKHASDHLFMNRNVLKLITYGLLSLLYLHWAACINVIFPIYLNKNDKLQSTSWAMDPPILNQTTEIMYEHSIYRATASFLCVIHSADLTLTAEDIIILTISYITGYILCCLIFVVLLQMVLSMNTPATKYESIINQLNQYMMHRQLPITLQHRLLQYYGDRFNKSYFRESAILPILSDRLQMEINLHCYTTLVENVSVLHDLPDEIVGEIVSSLKLEVFLPNDYIIKAGTAGDCMYFISRGTVAVSTPTGREVCHLQDGAYFGEIALIRKDQKRIANVLAIEICEMYRLDRRIFKTCLSTQPEVYKKLEKVAQDRFNRTNFLEELHKKHILERTLARKHDYVD